MDRTTHRGRRWSTARAYLRPARGRPNLAVRTRTLATRVRFEGWRRSASSTRRMAHGARSAPRAR